MPTTIRLRRGTKSEWDSANPVLAVGEPGLITGTGEVRIGDGTTAFNSLPDTNRFLSEDILSGTFRKSQNAAKVVRSTDQSISDGTVETIVWGSAEFDDLGMWDSGNPSRLTVPSGVGRVRVLAKGGWVGNSTGQRQLRAHLNGSFKALFDIRQAIDSTEAEGSLVLTVSAGDYVELAVFQNSGAALDFRADREAQFVMEALA